MGVIVIHYTNITLRRPWRRLLLTELTENDEVKAQLTLCSV